MEEMKKIREWLPAVAAVALLYGVLFCLGITCPIKFFTGVSCAGCGMTRAWLSLLRLDVKRAFTYHPLFWTLPLVALILLFRNKIPKKVFKVLLFTVGSLSVIVYIYRMINGSTIVVFEPENNIVFRAVKYFLR